MSRILTATPPRQALQDYLDDLLQMATEPDPEASSAEPLPAPAPAALQPEPAARPVRLPEEHQAVPLKVAVAERLRADADGLARVLEPVSPENPVSVLENASSIPHEKALVPVVPPAAVRPGRPAWSGEALECLLFDVAGLKLAVPLVCLGAIYPLEMDSLTPLFGQPDWFLGILPGEPNLKVVDTARWLMPERYRDELRQDLHYLISIQGYQWGLAVHQVNHSIHLDPGRVKWRTERSRRPWLAGTLIDQMCALLDVGALAQLIAEKEQQARNPGKAG